MQFLRPYIEARPRVFGALFFLAGLIGAGNLWSVHRGGETFLSRDTTYTPLMLLFGLATVIEPRLLLAWVSNRTHPVPTRFKVYAVLVVLAAVGIALYLDMVVFKGWKSTPLGSAPHKP